MGARPVLQAPRRFPEAAFHFLRPIIVPRHLEKAETSRFRAVIL
jgi:hypothetical protein